MRSSSALNNNNNNNINAIIFGSKYSRRLLIRPIINRSIEPHAARDEHERNIVAVAHDPAALLHAGLDNISHRM